MRFRVALGSALAVFVMQVGCGEEEKFQKKGDPPSPPTPLVVADSCIDGVKNQDEADADCGGTICTMRCVDGKACTADTDCTGNMCDNGHCLTIPPNEGNFTIHCRPAAPNFSDHPCVVRVDHPSLPGDGLGPGYAIQPGVQISARTLCTTKMQREELGEVLHFTGRVWNVSSNTYEWHQGYAMIQNPNGQEVPRSLAASPYDMKAMSTREWLGCRQLGYPLASPTTP